MTSAHFQYAFIAAVVAIAVIVVVRFEVYCVTDIVRADERELRYLSKAGWVAVCLISVPIGGIVYLLCGRTR
jgi:hypothetical protein